MAHTVLDESIPVERYFEEISRIPRNSGQEEKIAGYLMKFAVQRGLEVYEDAIHNVVIRKKASPGFEDREPVMLQAHVDMVCVKTPESRHDFTRDPIALAAENGLVRALDTSLGADDGFGVAYMLALLDDDTLRHPLLECVFTVREEIGCQGVKALDVTQLKARRLISLDGCEDTNTYVANFRSDLVVLEKEAVWGSPCGRSVRVEVKDVYTNVYDGVTHQECGNGVKILARLLKAAAAGVDGLRLAELNGGAAENLIPERAEAVFCYTGSDFESLRSLLESAFDQMVQELENPACAGRLTVSETEAPSRALSPEDSRALVNLLFLLPNNTFQAAGERMTSVSNTGVVRLSEKKMEIILSSRSRYVSSAAELLRRYQALAELSGFSFETSVRYESWPYQKDSNSRALRNRVTEELYGYTLEEQVAAGGLEIAEFVGRIPGLDAVELGANHKNLHSVDEYMELESFHRMYQVVRTMLEKMALEP